MFLEKSINQFISTLHNNTIFDINILHSLHKLAFANTFLLSCFLKSGLPIILLGQPVDKIILLAGTREWKCF